MTFTEQRNETYHVVSCYTCGNPFGVTDELYRRAVKHHKGSLFCPACGKGTCWTGKTEEEKRIAELERRLEWERQESERQRKRKESAENSLRATKGVVTKMKKRVGSGVCPCCNRTFKQLAKHMAEKHPDFSKS